jgi:ribosomal-protein-alanine N-acetyltransferase
MPDPSATRLILIADCEVPRRLRDETTRIVGFLIARHVAGEWELENIVVAEEFRGKGAGTQLMEALLAHARQTKSESVFLEVRESNVAARKLYEKLGFEEIGRRKSYYTSPLEDAVLYSKNLGAREISI